MKRRQLLKLFATAPAAVAVSVLPRMSGGSDRGSKRWCWFCNQCTRGKWTEVGEVPGIYPIEYPGRCNQYHQGHRWEYVGEFEGTGTADDPHRCTLAHLRTTPTYKSFHAKKADAAPQLSHNHKGKVFPTGYRPEDFPGGTPRL